MSSMGRWPIVACVFLSASVEAAAAAEGSSSSSAAAFVRPFSLPRLAPRGLSNVDSSIAGGRIAAPGDDYCFLRRAAAVSAASPPPRSALPLCKSTMTAECTVDGGSGDGGGVWFLALVGAAAYLSGYASEGYDNHAL